MARTYYDILGIDKNASRENILKAKNRLKFGEDRVNFDMFKKIDEAFDVLYDPESRRKYDESLEKNNDELKDDTKISEPSFITSNTGQQDNNETSYNEELEKLKQDYENAFQEITDFKYEYDERDQIANHKELFALQEKARAIYCDIIILCEKMNIEIPVEEVGDRLSKITVNEYERELSNGINPSFNVEGTQNTATQREAKLPVNVIPFPNFTIQKEVDQSKSEIEKQKQFEILKDNYQKAIDKIIALNNKNLNSQEKDYSDWKPSLHTAYRAYDELVDFCEKNNINKDFESVDEILDKCNISKIPTPQKNKPVDLTKNKNSEPNISVDPSIYENAKYIQTNKLSDSNYETLKEIYEFNKKNSKIKFTAIGAGLGFILLISPIGGFGPIVSTLGAIGIGKLFNSWIKKKQSKQKFTLTKESYTGKITEINTTESQIIHSSNQLLKEEIEDLAKHPSNDFKLQLLKLKYINQLNILNQIISVRKNSKSKKGGLTYDSLNIAALEQEKNKAKSDLKRINQLITRDRLIDEIGAENVDLSSLKYKNLTIGNMLLKEEIKKRNLELQNQQYEEIDEQEEHSKTR